MALAAGVRLGHYLIVAPLGSGGMGEVYRARDEKLGREVAVKVLPQRLSQEPGALARFEREARAVATLSHPNILAIHDFGTEDDVAYAVMELLEGETLRYRLSAGPISTNKAREYALEIARGLAAAHEKGIVHRDLKPDNVFISRDGRIKILDFGIAKQPEALGPDAATLGRDTHPGVVLGTAGYMSPEQVRGGAVDARSDIFSFGSLLYEMLTGQRAFKGDSAIETMNAILNTDPPEMAAEQLPLPPALERIVRHCLEKAPEQRFRSAHDLAFALENVSAVSTGAMVPPRQTAGRRRIAVAVFGLGLAIVVALGSAVSWRRYRAARSDPLFQQLTFRRGTVTNARFASDNRTVVYAAAWDGAPVEPFLTRTDNPESRRLGFTAVDLVALSARGEMALSARRQSLDAFSSKGTLARAPLVGGALREVLEGVVAADFSPDGSAFAVVREARGQSRLEFPVGHVLYQTDGWISHPRIAPDARRVAFAVHPEIGDDAGSVAVSDLDGKLTVLAANLASLQGLAWAPKGREVWYAGGEGAVPRALLATRLDGTKRRVFRTTGDVTLHDIDSSGRVLVTRDIWGAAVTVLTENQPPGDASWLDYSVASGVSADGSVVVGVETGAGGGPNYSFYVRRTDGSPAVRLGEGNGLAISPDGSRVLASAGAGQLSLIPVGAGELRSLPLGPVASVVWASFFPDGRRVVLSANEPGRLKRVYLLDLNGGVPKPITPEGVSFAWDAVSPDGQRILLRNPDRSLVAFSIGGGKPTDLSVLGPEDVPIRWGADGKTLCVYRLGEIPCRVESVDLTTGVRQLVRVLVPNDPAGVVAIRRIFMTPDQRTIVYTFNRFLSDLYLGLGLWRESS